jgi:hypothetical protein
MVRFEINVSHRNAINAIINLRTPTRIAVGGIEGEENSS